MNKYKYSPTIPIFIIKERKLLLLIFVPYVTIIRTKPKIIIYVVFLTESEKLFNESIELFDILYCYIYINGGCYFDCKQILKFPIRTFLESKKTLVLCNDVIDNALLNANIFSIKNNPILEKTIKDCVYNIINKLGTYALDITGPIFFYKSIKDFINEYFCDLPIEILSNITMAEVFINTDL